MPAQFIRVIKHNFTWWNIFCRPLSSSHPSTVMYLFSLCNLIFASFCLGTLIIAASLLTMSKHFQFQPIIHGHHDCSARVSFGRNDTEGLVREPPNCVLRCFPSFDWSLLKYLHMISLPRSTHFLQRCPAHPSFIVILLISRAVSTDHSWLHA